MSNNAAAQRVKVACKLCNSRRVKCDRTERQSCTNCTLSDQACEPIDSKRGRYERAPNRRSSIARSLRSAGGTDYGQRSAQDTRLSHQTQEVIVTNTNDENTAPSEGSDMLFARLVDSPQTPSDLSRRSDNQILYLGESYNLSYVIRDLSSPAGPSADRGPAVSQLHFLIPENIEVRARNVPRDLHFETEEKESLRRNGALSKPSKAVSNELVKTFFRWTYPVFPILDRAEFLKLYEDGTGSLLVLQAVFFAGATHCDISVIRLAGFETRNAARLTFYRRAKALFDADYEADPMANVQAVCLLTLWCGGPLDQKDTWHWLGVAVGLAQSLGMHRCMRHSNVRKGQEQLWKRIWWSLYIRDVHAASALGRPPHILHAFCDVEPLSEDDFQEAEAVTSSLAETSTKVVADYSLHAAKLAQLMYAVLVQKYAPSSPEDNSSPNPDLAESMTTWSGSLPASLSCSSQERTASDFWPIILQINYHNYLILLHRSSDRSNSDPRDTTLLSATRITRLLEDLMYSDLLRFAPINIISSLFAALTIHVRCLLHRESSQTEILDYRVRLCMLALEKLQDHWPVAAWTLRLFEKILARLRAQQANPKRGPASGPDVPAKRARGVAEWPDDSHTDSGDVRGQESADLLGLEMPAATMPAMDDMTPSLYPIFEDADFLSSLFADDLYEPI